MNHPEYVTTRDGNLATTTRDGEYCYTVCMVCRCYANKTGCTAETCACPVASDFKVGDLVKCRARGSNRTAKVTAVKRTRLVVEFHLKSGEVRTSTVKFGMFWKVES